MSKNIFEVEDSKINSDRRIYKLETDLLKGLKTAVNNNQTYRALEYLVLIVEILDEKLSTDSTSDDFNPEDLPISKPKKAATKSVDEEK
jgi:predicted metallo-beta-lactamase superfamily hydrolase